MNYQILSDESRKYFHSAIPMSGSVGSNWALSKQENHLDLAFKLAKDLNQTANSYDQLVDFLKLVPADEFHLFGLFFGKKDDVFDITFAPVIERK